MPLHSIIDRYFISISIFLISGQFCSFSTVKLGWSSIGEKIGVKVSRNEMEYQRKLIETQSQAREELHLARLNLIAVQIKAAEAQASFWDDARSMLDALDGNSCSKIGEFWKISNCYIC